MFEEVALYFSSCASNTLNKMEKRRNLFNPTVQFLRLNPSCWFFRGGEPATRALFRIPQGNPRTITCEGNVQGSEKQNTRTLA
jgi:hypothetical protein